MRYYTLEPEVAGGLGERSVLDASTHPPTVSRLHYELEGWLGDDLLQSFPCFVVTARLKRALESIPASGCEFDSVEVTKSQTFAELYPGRDLPEFFWLKPTGRAGLDDFGMSADHVLVASERALKCLRAFSLANCETGDYERQS